MCHQSALGRYDREPGMDGMMQINTMFVKNIDSHKTGENQNGYCSTLCTTILLTTTAECLTLVVKYERATNINMKSRSRKHS